jgi:NAD(P)-dependent dehydrogenase (short-subunit alcohol dehydrogenase family)
VILRDGVILRGGGRIVVVSSLAVAVGSVFAGPQYVASKAALEGLVRSVASPGSHTGSSSMRRPGRHGDGDDGRVRLPRRAVPFGRVAQPDDIAGAIAFLCGPRAGYITGITLHVNGGTHFGC